MISNRVIPSTPFAGRRRQRQTPRPYTQPGNTAPEKRGSWIGREIDTYIGLSNLQRDLPKGSPCIVLGASGEQLASMAGISVLSQSKGQIPSRAKRHRLLDKYRKDYPKTAINITPGWFDGALKFERQFVPILGQLLRQESHPIVDPTVNPTEQVQENWRQMTPLLRKACGTIRVGDAVNWRSLVPISGDKPVVVLMNNLVHYFNRSKEDGSPDGDRDYDKINALLDTFKGLPVGSIIAIGRQDFLPDIRTDLSLQERGLKPLKVKRSTIGVAEDLANAGRAPALMLESDKPFLFKVV